MRPSLPKKIAAFTLIELLASMAILLVLMSVVFGVFNQASKAWVLGESRTDTFQGARLAIEMMTRELEGAIATNNNPTATGKKITFLAIKDAPNLLSAASSPSVKLSATPPNDQIFFVSNASDSKKRDDSDLTEYGYFVVFCNDDYYGMNAGHYYLLRQQTRSTGSGWDALFSNPTTWPSQTLINQFQKVPILENVLRFDLTYEKADATQPQGTAEAPDWSATPDQLPLAVHITMSVLDARAAARLAAITTVAGVPTVLSSTELAKIPYQIETLSNEGVKNTLRDSLRTFYRTVYLKPVR